MSPEKRFPENLHVLNYVTGLSEYAYQVRSEMVRRKDTDFCVAVDLPAGLKTDVIAAVKRLPEVTLVVDRLKRGIQIIPSSAPIEAVRSFLEAGFEIEFLDACLPVTGNMEEYRYFVDLCRRHGIGPVLDRSQDFGISPGDILKSWQSQVHGEGHSDHFMYLDGVVPDPVPLAAYRETEASPYLQTRCRSMAGKVSRLLDTGLDVLLVSCRANTPGILHYLDKEEIPIDDSFVVPARTLTVAERDVMHITDEIPYFMYLYELFRDLPVRREEWIRGLFCDTGEEKVSPMIAEAVLRYSGKLALADHSLFPELYNILAAAKFVAGDDYAIEVYEKAVSYPPNKDSPPQCQFGKVLDFNFEPLSKYRSLILRSRHLIEKKSPVDWVLEESLKIKRFQWYSRWTRTQESYQAEREFMSYMTPRFTACEPSEEERISREYVCGFGDGFDIRETIRMQHTGKIYISEIKPVNTAAYVLDYRNWPPGSQTKETGFYDHVFMDKYYPWIGLTKSSGHHFRSGVMVAFNRLALSPTQIFAGIDTGRPLSSCVDIALRHTRKVFVWTDSPEELVIPAEASRQVRVMPRSVVPAPVYSLMQEFDIIGNRYEDRPGD